jgi:hypothetical protein
MSKYVKNNTDVIQTWCGQEFQPADVKLIPPLEEHTWSHASTFLIAVATGSALVSSDGETFYTDFDEALSFLRDEVPKDVIINDGAKVSQLPPVSIHCMEPWGCVGDAYQPVNEGHTSTILLSEQSEDGCTFAYTGSSVTVEVGNYIFQKRNTRKSWVTTCSATTLTVERPYLSNGPGVYSKGFYVDATVPDWADMMYVWGCTATVLEYEPDGTLETKPCKDLLECSVFDPYDMWRNDDFCMAALGVPAAEAPSYLTANKWEINGEYKTVYGTDAWTKYYDESWICNAERQYIPATDGAPGGIPSNFALRYALFSSTLEADKWYEVLLDYRPTSIPEGSL